MNELARLDDLGFGLAVGHASDAAGATGLTVVRGISAPMRASAHVLGRATGSRELALLDPSAHNDRIDAILATIEADVRKAKVGAFYFPSSRRPLRVAHMLAGGYGIGSCAILYRHQGLFERGTANPAVRLIPRKQ